LLLMPGFRLGRPPGAMVEHGLLQRGFERGGWRGGREH
jgi:hypothetical protein